MNLKNKILQSCGGLMTNFEFHKVSINKSLILNGEQNLINKDDKLKPKDIIENTHRLNNSKTID